PNTLDFREFPNQQYRVDILRSTALPNSMNPADILLSVFRTDAGDPATLAPTRVTADLTRFRGQTVKLRFAEVDNLGFFQAGVDDVKINTHPIVPRIRVNDPRVAEGDAGTARLVFTVRLNLPTTVPVTVRFITADGSAK